MDRPPVSIIDDDPTFRYHVARHLKRAGREIVTAADEERGFNLLCDEHPAAVILDAQAETSISVVRLVDRIRAERELQRLPIVVCSPDDRFLEAHGSYLRSHRCRLVGRPLDLDALLAVVDGAAAGHWLGSAAVAYEPHA